MVLEKTLESPLDFEEIKPVNPKGNQPWVFIGRTDAPILWLPDAKSQLFGKYPGSRKDWGWEKRVIEDEMVGWHHQFDGHEFEQAPGDGEGQEAWRAAVHGVQSQTRLGNWTTMKSKITGLNLKIKGIETPIFAFTNYNSFLMNNIICCKYCGSLMLSELPW